MENKPIRSKFRSKSINLDDNKKVIKLKIGVGIPHYSSIETYYLVYWRLKYEGCKKV